MGPTLGPNIRSLYVKLPLLSDTRRLRSGLVILKMRKMEKSLVMIVFFCVCVYFRLFGSISVFGGLKDVVVCISDASILQ